MYMLTQRFLEKAVYCKWREKFGGNRLVIITGSSSIQPDMIRVFAAAGINIYEGYGLSETSPVIAVNDPAHKMVRIGTVGPILSGVEVKFADDGEILTRGPHVMMGYYKDPEYTAQVIEPDGWFHTGDIGTLVAGKYLKITDRKKDIFKLSAGKYVAPQLIENMLRSSEYIEQVMVIGENEKCAAAIISPNFNTLHFWALKYKLHYRDNAELIAMPQVHDKYKKVLEVYNKQLAPHEQIKLFRLVTDDWNPNNGFLSPTLKLRRAPLMEKYKDLIADIYGKEKTSSNAFFSAFKSDELPSINLPWKRN
jgi:long-chain acyl-CoA synthetase